MTTDTNVEKLASVFNTTSQQGKNDFVKMLWSNQPSNVQSQLLPLLCDEALQALKNESE